MKVGRLVQKRFSNDRSPVGIIIRKGTAARLIWWVVEWAGSGKLEVISQDELRVVQ